MAEQSAHSKQLKNPKYRNWVKAGLGLKYVKEGLETFTEDVVTQQHTDIITAVQQKHNLQPVTCGLCNLYSLQPDHVRNRNRQCPLGQKNCNCMHPGGKIPCPNNVCGAIYDEIIKTHASTPPTPYWKNTDVKDWCTDPWAVAKCFINAPGYTTSAKAEEIDCTGLLHLYINSKCLQRKIQCQITGQDVFTKTRSARNTIYHSNNMEMEDVGVNEHIDNMIAVLEDGKELINRQESKVAVLKLKELKTSSFVMSTQDEAIVIKDAFDEIDQVSQLKETVAKGEESITQKENETVQSLQVTRQQLEDKAREILDNIKKDGCDIKTDLENGLRNALDQLKSEMKNTTTLAKKTISKHKDESCLEIEQTKTAAIETMEVSSENLKRTAEVAILKHKEEACSEMKRMKSTAIEMMQTSSENMITSTGKEILKHKDESCLEMEQTKTAAIETMAASVETFSSKLYSSESTLSDRIDKMEEKLYTNEGIHRMKDVLSLEQEDSAITKRKNDLREDLIRFYTFEHETILLDPLFEQKDTPVINFYVMPDMNIIETQNKRPLSQEEVKTSVKSLSDVFMKDGEFSREVYLTAEAGYGKTAFAKYLALIWCQAHSPDSRNTGYFDEDHLNAMRQFELLFLVLLRDSSDNCSIDEMILNQIKKETSNSDILNIPSLKAVLHRERYLVILDGLDEWTHPRSPKSIPHRTARENCVILTTTRPWKLGVINLKTSQINKKIEIAKLSSKSAELLKERAISKIKGLDIKRARKLVKEFDAEVAKCSLGDLESVPLLLVYLISLWDNKIPLCQSRSGLYTNITELLLSRTAKKCPEISSPTCADVPQWLKCENCRKFFLLLKALGKLAFEALFNETRENRLVFDSSVAETILKETDPGLKFSLKSGIITQSKSGQITHSEGQVVKQGSKISFAHKSVQEYFSALYMSCQSESDVQKIVQENCKTLQDILDMSAVFVFISGMNGEMMSTISRELMSVISENEETIAYRSRCEKERYYITIIGPLKDIQNMYISCIKENPDNNDLKLCLQDFFIDKQCEQENYKTTLQRLAKQNKNNIKSVCIVNHGWCSLHEIIDSFELTDLNHLLILYCYSKCKEADIIRLLSRTVKYASVESRGGSCSMTSTLCRRFETLHQLEGIYINNFKMSHAVLKEFLNYLTNRKSMKQIRLSRLFCTDHGTSCDDVKLDLSQHTGVRSLELHEVPLSQLNINVESLEECDVGPIDKPGVVSSWLSQLPAASKLNRLKCRDLESAAVETLVQTLPLLVHVQKVELYEINLGKRSLRFSPDMVNIEYVNLSWVIMRSSSFRDLVKHVEQLPHSVTVEIGVCTITPKTECKAVKKYVRKSENFVVTWDNQYEFDFVKPAVTTTTSH